MKKAVKLGVMQPYEAIKMARERGLDLVEISPTADPPVCKITDYGKFLYQQNKKPPTSSARAAAAFQLKEQSLFSLRQPREHDYQVRKNQIIRFLGEGHKVRAMIFHRGREMAHQEVGRAKMTRLLGEIGEHGQIQTMPVWKAMFWLHCWPQKKGCAGGQAGGADSTASAVVLPALVAAAFRGGPQFSIKP